MAEMPAQERLGRIAKLLKAERHPYYVRHPVPPQLRRDFPSEGWYWIPEGEKRVQFLARDAFDAYHRLMTDLEIQTAIEDDA
jgi:hypothetical protein